MTNRELAEKLRCVSSAHPEGPACEECPFCGKEPVPEALRQAVGEEFWAYCDSDRVCQAAADALESTTAHVAVLQKEIEGLRAQLATVQHQNEQLREANALTVKATTGRLCREWVSVTERLPSDEKPVLAYYGFDNESGCLGMMFVGALSYFCFDPDPHWQHAGSNLVVTHWMPLPEPPREDV